jgi:transcriptional regulator with XRE-family HTH domain
MPKGARRRPARLAEKLCQIRHRLELTQEGLKDRLEQVGFVSNLDRADVSDFERGRRDPDILTLIILRPRGKRLSRRAGRRRAGSSGGFESLWSVMIPGAPLSIPKIPSCGRRDRRRIIRKWVLHRQDVVFGADRRFTARAT